MRHLLPLLLLAMPLQAAAQSYYPNLAGARYCQLRQMGIDKRQAVELAMRENWAPRRQSPTVVRDGKTYRLDDLDFATWMVRCQGN